MSISEEWLQRLNLSKQTVLYKKIVKNGCLYVSSNNNNDRLNNSYAQLKNGDYVKIFYFIVDKLSFSEHIIVQKIDTEEAYNNVYNMLRKINERTAVPTNEIEKVCVHMNINNGEYLCCVPNLHYY